MSVFAAASLPVFAAGNHERREDSSGAAPDWLRDGVIYQIFPDRFFNGRKANDVQSNSYTYAGNPTIHRKWGASPKAKTGEDQGLIFFGGDLSGIRKKLSYIKKSVGANIVYMTPIFKSPSNHKYDTSDYDAVDPAFGSNKDLSTLSQQIHKSCHGQKGYLILDGVFNHTGDSHYWFGKRDAQARTCGAFQSLQSPYRDFYTFMKWPDQYARFMTFDSLPKLNFGSDEVKRKIFSTPDSVAQRYLASPYHIDGWRLDAAKHADVNDGQGENESNHTIWREFRQAIKQANVQATIIGEFWGNAKAWTADGDQWDSVTNFEGFTQPVSQWITGKTYTGELAPYSVSQFDAQLKLTREYYPFDVQQLLSNHLSNHDISRFAERAGGDIRKTKLAMIFQMTYIGVPTIYYGDEYGMTGDSEQGNRKSMDWTRARAHNPAVSLCRKLVCIRAKHQALRCGQFTTLRTDDSSKIYSFARATAAETIVIVLNNDALVQSVNISMANFNVADGTKLYDELNDRRLQVRNGHVTVTTPPYFLSLIHI